MHRHERSDAPHRARLAPGGRATGPANRGITNRSPQALHYTCLANLVSNAIDACVVSDKKQKSIKLSCYEKDGTIVYEMS